MYINYFNCSEDTPLRNNFENNIFEIKFANPL